MIAEATTERDCPFYGRHIAIILSAGACFPGPGIRFVASGGSECAIQVPFYHSCDLAFHGTPVYWRVCPAWLRAVVDFGED